jgi:cobalamin biosynthesis Mg chelatase CobN
MEAEGGDWYKVTATFTNVEENGLALIFNNGVGDVEANDVGFSEADAEAVKASGIPNTTNATKEQTGNITLGKKAIAKIEGGMPSDLYITYDGKTTELLTEAPESYTSAVSTTSTDTSSNTTSTDSSNSTGTASADTTATGSTTNSSSTTAPKTGDAVAVSVVALGALAAVAFVASKKRVNG